MNLWGLADALHLLSNCDPLRVRKLLIVSTDKAIGGRGLMLLQVMTCSSFALP
jgi:hypothetical protein